MAFRLVKDPMDTQAEYIEISSTTVAVGDMLALEPAANEYYELADANTEFWAVKYVAIESATTSDTEVLAIRVHEGQLWEADATNASDSADTGQRMILTDKATVNNTGTNSAADAAIFLQTGYAGETSDNTILGYISSTGSPDPTN